MLGGYYSSLPAWYQSKTQFSTSNTEIAKLSRFLEFVTISNKLETGYGTRCGWPEYSDGQAISENPGNSVYLLPFLIQNHFHSRWIGPDWQNYALLFGWKEFVVCHVTISLFCNRVDTSANPSSFSPVLTKSKCKIWLLYVVAGISLADHFRIVQQQDITDVHKEWREFPAAQTHSERLAKGGDIAGNGVSCVFEVAL